MSQRPEVLTIPASDSAFREHVALLKGDASDPEALQRRLRRIYPLVLVRERPLSGQPAWYVYRDGRWRSPEGTWWEDSSLPRVVASPEGWLLSVNHTAAGILGIDPESPTEYHFTDFAVPGTLEDSEALFGVVAKGHPLDATIQLRPMSGSVVAVQLRAWADGTGIVGVFRLDTDVDAVVEDVDLRIPTSVRTVPSTDVAFRGYVLRALARMPEPTADGLALRVRRLYPHAAISSDGESWIAKRGPDATDRAVTAWWRDPELPRVRYDAMALILEANPAADALFGHALVGHHWQEFVLAGTTDEVAVMLDILAEVGAAESRFRMPRADGTLLEFDSYTSVEGDELVTVMRSVRPTAAE